MPDLSEVHFAILPKGAERFIVIWGQGQRADALRTIAEWAADPDLWFTWFDAARMAQAIREFDGTLSRR